MAELTVREQLAEALERIEALAQPDPEWPISAESLLRTAGRIARANLFLLARAEPEGGEKSHKREDLLVALDELFQDHYYDTSPEKWLVAKAAFEAARSELSCPDICDTSCPCYQEGLGAQREPAGRGTA